MSFKVIFTPNQIGVIKRLIRGGFKDIYYCPECQAIHHYKYNDFVPYTSNSYYKCKSCGYHIYAGTYDVRNLLKGPVRLDRKNMRYYSAKNRQHVDSSNDNLMTKKQYERQK